MKLTFQIILNNWKSIFRFVQVLKFIFISRFSLFASVYYKVWLHKNKLLHFNIQIGFDLYAIYTKLPLFNIIRLCIIPKIQIIRELVTRNIKN